MAPGTVPLRNLKATSQKACLENPDSSALQESYANSRGLASEWVLPNSHIGAHGKDRMVGCGL